MLHFLPTTTTRTRTANSINSSLGEYATMNIPTPRTGLYPNSGHNLYVEGLIYFGKEKVDLIALVYGLQAKINDLEKEISELKMMPPLINGGPEYIKSKNSFIRSAERDPLDLDDS